MGTENITVPGKQTLIFIAKIEGAAEWNRISTRNKTMAKWKWR